MGLSSRGQGSCGGLAACTSGGRAFGQGPQQVEQSGWSGGAEIKVGEEVRERKVGEASPSGL